MAVPDPIQVSVKIGSQTITLTGVPSSFVANILTKALELNEAIQTGAAAKEEAEYSRRAKPKPSSILDEDESDDEDDDELEPEDEDEDDS